MGGIFAFWTKTPDPTSYPFIAGGVQSFTQRLMAVAGPYLKVAGIGSFVGVIVTEARAMFVTLRVQEKALYDSFGVTKKEAQHWL